MTYFAVLHDEPALVEVERCHINIWAPCGLFRRYVLFDVGLGVRSKPNSVLKKDNELRLVIPFASAEASDIQHVLTAGETASVVFGQRVDILGRDKQLKIGTDVLDLGGCTIGQDEKFPDSNGCSLWNLTLADAMQSDSVRYLRIRFKIKAKGSTWSSESGGQLLDFRVADTRGTTLRERWKGLETKFVPLTKLNAFVIVPARLIVYNSHPTFQYVRLLERHSWAEYLKKSYRHFSTKMVVYYWRNDESKPITAEKPFRAFLHLNESHRTELARERWRLVICCAISTVILLSAVPSLQAARDKLVGQIPIIWAWLAGLSLVAVLLGLQKVVSFVTFAWGLLAKGWGYLKKKWSRRQD